MGAECAHSPARIEVLDWNRWHRWPAVCYRLQTGEAKLWAAAGKCRRLNISCSMPLHQGCAFTHPTKHRNVRK
jgi:hypothetical protein